MLVITQAVEGHADAILLTRAAGGDEQKLAVFIRIGFDLVNQRVLICQDGHQPSLVYPPEEGFTFGQAILLIWTFWGRR